FVWFGNPSFMPVTEEPRLIRCCTTRCWSSYAVASSCDSCNASCGIACAATAARSRRSAYSSRVVIVILLAVANREQRQESCLPAHPRARACQPREECRGRQAVAAPRCARHAKESSSTRPHNRDSTFPDRHVRDALAGDERDHRLRLAVVQGQRRVASPASLQPR